MKLMKVIGFQVVGMDIEMAVIVQVAQFSLNIIPVETLLF